MRKTALFIFFILNVSVFSQRYVIDSLKFMVKSSAEQDTLRAFYLNELAWTYLDFSLDTSEIYRSEAANLSKKIEYEEGVLTALNIKGLIARMKGNLDEAIKLGEELLAKRIKQGAIAKLTGAYSNLGSAYLEKGDYARALRNYNKAYDVSVTLKNVENQATILGNIALLYQYSELKELALETYRKALELNKTLNDESGLASLYLNMASVYDNSNLNKDAQQYYLDSYKIYKKLGNPRMLSTVVFNLAVNSRIIEDTISEARFINEMYELTKQLNDTVFLVDYHMGKTFFYIHIQKFNEAIKEADKGLSMADSVNGSKTFALLLAAKSDAYFGLKNYDKALLYSDMNIRRLMLDGSIGEIANVYLNRSKIYRAKGDYENCLKYFERAIVIKDSINSENYITKMATINSLNQLDKKEKELEVANSEKEKIELENKRQFILLIVGSVVGLLIFVLLIFNIRAYRIKKKDNILLEEQKKEIHKQKTIVEEKQRETLDSIQYAKQIQRTLLANHEMANKVIPDSFVVFKPKDIVSGDFYWATKKDDRFYFAVCDSTGHGVPGAFMSLLNISFLNEAINEKEITEPNRVLDFVRKRLIDNISQEGRQDGMDGILICIEAKSNTITYAAAHNAPLLIRNKELMRLSADKMPVGMGDKLDPFSAFSIETQKGDMLYLYTDGYADQFGGPKGKKFRYKQLEELLLECSAEDTFKQKEKIDTAFEDWRGRLEQVDDVCIIGIRL